MPVGTGRYSHFIVMMPGSVHLCCCPTPVPSCDSEQRPSNNGKGRGWRNGPRGPDLLEPCADGRGTDPAADDGLATAPVWLSLIE